MTSKKDKQIRELEKSEKMYKSFFWYFLIILFLLLIFSGYLVVNKIYLESQLQSCQEKVPVWTLKVECNYSNGEIIWSERNFTDYQKYLDYGKFYSRGENCEVLP